MYRVHVNHFNFSNGFNKWITIFNTEIMDTVLQVGFFVRVFSQLKEVESRKIQSPLSIYLLCTNAM